jgi:uncharacterized protein
MEFQWDEGKDRSNRRKRGISFDLAMQAFEDPFQVSVQDREVGGEIRWQTIGVVEGVLCSDCRSYRGRGK